MSDGYVSAAGYTPKIGATIFLRPRITTFGRRDGLQYRIVDVIPANTVPEIYVEEVYLLPDDYTGGAMLRPPPGSSADLSYVLDELGATAAIDLKFEEAVNASAGDQEPVDEADR